ncbi:MAG: glycosyltransferase family 4 protein [Candidatus Omnitrophica bacterium]|nr:glycosyltransferase family 4 protein [Candidatus Omnitrophota bacterium]
MKILYLLIGITETSMAYNELVLPLAGKHNIAVCSFFPFLGERNMSVNYREGDGTLGGFIRVVSGIVRSGKFDVVHCHSPHLAAIWALVLLGKGRIDLLKHTLLTVHSSYANYKPRNRILLLLSFLVVRKIVFVSRSSLESFPWFFRAIAGKKASVIKNCVNLNRIDRVIRSFRPEAGKKGAMRVICAAQQIKAKDLGVLLSAFYGFSGLGDELVLVGDGPLRQKLERKAEMLGIGERVRFLGIVNREQIYRLFCDSDIFVSSSKIEGLPVAPLEAMACRCPVILSDIAPHKEIAEDNSGVVFFKQGDSRELAGILKVFRTLERNEIQHLTHKSRKHIETNFPLENMNRAYESIYEEIGDKR